MAPACVLLFRRHEAEPARLGAPDAAARPFSSASLGPSGPGGGKGPKSSGGLGVGGAIATGVLGTIGLTFMFPGVVFNLFLGVAGLLAGRALAVRALGWPDQKRPFLRRSFSLFMRRVFVMGVQHLSTTGFVQLVAANVVQSAVLEDMDRIARIGAGIPRGIAPEAMRLRDVRVVDGKLMAVVEGAMALAEAPEDTGAAAGGKGPPPGVAGLRVEVVVRDASVPMQGSDPLSASDIRRVMGVSGAGAMWKMAGASAWEGFTGTGHDPDATEQGGTLLDRLRRSVRGAAPGTPESPEILRGFASMPGAGPADGAGDSEQVKRSIPALIPLLELDVVSAELAMRMPGGAIQAVPLRLPSEPVRAVDLVQDEAFGAQSKGDPILAGLREVLLEKQRAADKAEDDGRIRWEDGGDDPEETPRQKERHSGKGRVIDATFQERT